MEWSGYCGVNWRPLSLAIMKHILIITIAAVLLVGTAFADPVHDAASTGDLARVQAELDKGVDVNAKDTRCWVSLFGKHP